MPLGFSFAYSASNAKTPVIRSYIAGISLSGNITTSTTTVSSGAIYNGYLAVATLSATFGDGTIPALRALHQEDITDTYQNGSSANVGILGMFQEDFTTNASGQINGSPIATGVPPVIYPMPSPSARYMVDFATGKNRIPLVLWDPENVFAAYIDPAYTSNIQNDVLVGLPVGIVLTQQTTGINSTFVSPSATTKVATIIAIDYEDTTYFNTTNSGSGTRGLRVFVRPTTTYDQSINGTYYDD